MNNKNLSDWYTPNNLYKEMFKEHFDQKELLITLKNGRIFKGTFDKQNTYEHTEKQINMTKIEMTARENMVRIRGAEGTNPDPEYFERYWKVIDFFNSFLVFNAARFFDTQLTVETLVVDSNEIATFAII